MKSHWQMFAAYNAWANRRLYDHAARLSNDDYRADRGAFFKSVHGTLNHLLVADRIWMARFTGSGEPAPRLDAIVCEHFNDLRAARVAEDARIVAFIDSLNEANLSGTFRYRAVTSPAEFEQDLASALAHFFNHQTHHRGQIHCLMTGLVGAAPELDFLFYQREVGAGSIRRIA
jgi:uncharacterized damage-inducible protein DinB